MTTMPDMIYPGCFEWYSPARYYRLDVTMDLFGVWIIKRTWRSRYAKYGQTLTISTRNKDEVESWINHIHKLRIQRGYALAD
jgi:hypothetical protein